MSSTQTAEMKQLIPPSFALMITSVDIWEKPRGEGFSGSFLCTGKRQGSVPRQAGGPEAWGCSAAFCVSWLLREDAPLQQLQVHLKLPSGWNELRWFASVWRRAWGRKPGLEHSHSACSGLAWRA